MTEDTETNSGLDFDPLTMPSIGTDDEQCNNDQLDNTREEMQDRNIQVQDNDEDNGQDNDEDNGQDN